MLLLLLRNSEGSPVVVAVPYRDDDFFNAIVDLLVATNEFGDVIYSRRPYEIKASGDEARIAVVTPADQVRQKPEGSERRQYREADYLLTIKVSAETVDEARAELDRLTAIAHHEIDGTDLLDASVPWNCGLKFARYKDGPGSQCQIEIRGTVAYAFDVVVGMRTTA